MGNQNAIGNRGGGRKTKYRPEFASKTTTHLCMLGLTNAQLAEHFGCDESQIIRWARRHVEFAQVLNAGRDAADCQVIHSLFKRATGFSYKRSRGFKTVQVENAKGEWVPHEKELFEQVYVPPDPVSIIYWLSNRRRDYWKRGDSGREPELQAEKRNKLKELWSALQPEPEEPLSVPEQRKPS